MLDYLVFVMAVRRKGKSKQPRQSMSKSNSRATTISSVRKKSAHEAKERPPTRVTRSSLSKLATISAVTEKRNRHTKHVTFQLPDKSSQKTTNAKNQKTDSATKAVAKSKERRAKSVVNEPKSGKPKTSSTVLLATPSGSKTTPPRTKATPAASEATPPLSTSSHLPKNVNYLTKGDGNITVIGSHLERGDCFTIGRPHSCTYSPKTKELLICDTMNYTVKALKTDGTNSRVLYNVNLPRDITVSEDGEFVYILIDQGFQQINYSSEIIKMTIDGRIVPGELTFWNELGVCRSIICYNQHIAVLSTNQKTIFLFNMELKLIRSFQLDEMLFPWSGIAVDDDSNFYIIEDGTGAIHVYSWQGEWLRKFGESDENIITTSGICVDGDGTVCVSRTSAHRIDVYDGDGNFIRAIGARGKHPGEFNFPGGLYLLEDGRLVVMDKCNFRLQIL